MSNSKTILLDENGNPVPQGSDAGDDKAIVQMSGERPANVIVVPLDEHVLFPGMTIPMVLTRRRSQEAVDFALSQGPFIALVPRIEPFSFEADIPDDQPPAKPEELVDTGVLARILKMLNLPDGNRSAVVECVARVRIAKYVRKDPFLIAKADYPPDTYKDTVANKALWRAARMSLQQVMKQFPDTTAARLASQRLDQLSP